MLSSRVRPSVRPSVRLSIGLSVLLSHAGIVPTAEHKITQTTPYDSPATLVSDAKNIGEI